MTTSGLILSAASKTVFNSNADYREEYTHVKVDGNQSFYLAYSEKNFQGSVLLILPQPDPVEVGFKIRSFQGHNTQGIVLFPDKEYKGLGAMITKSNPDITGKLPQGASSLLVSKGTWRLYSETSYGGGHLGDYTEGTCVSIKAEACKSLKILALKTATS